jgi:hypothetical protein
MVSYAEDFLAAFAATPDDVNTTDVHTELVSWLSQPWIDNTGRL